jgi:hypothetical protein
MDVRPVSMQLCVLLVSSKQHTKLMCKEHVCRTACAGTYWSIISVQVNGRKRELTQQANDTLVDLNSDGKNYSKQNKEIKGW